MNHQYSDIQKIDQGYFTDDYLIILIFNQLVIIWICYISNINLNNSPIIIKPLFEDINN